MAHQAQDTFVATMPDGTMRRVIKGEVLADRDDLVKLDQAGDGVLFKKLDLGDDVPPEKRGPGRPRKDAS